MSDQLENSPSPEKSEIQAQDRRSYLSLKSLFLDPNNYRFIDAETYVPVSDDQLTHAEVQRRTNYLILGKNAENVRDLIDSFRKNGFLPVDQIQVRRIGDSGKFLVVEGNRRVATLKYIENRYLSEGFELGKLDPVIFTKLPVVSYQEADESHHLVLMALKHISGNKKWPAINQAQLVRKLHDDHQMLIDDLCKSIGISKQEANSTLQTMELIDLYKASDYGDQFESEKYSIFREIIRNRKIKTWIGWDADKKQILKPENLERLFSWISAESIMDPDETEKDLIGNTRMLEPILVKSVQIRDLAQIIEDEQALSNLDLTRNLTEATLSSEALGKDKVKNAISIIGQEVGSIFNMSQLIGDADRGEIETLSKKLKSLLHLGEKQAITGTSRGTHLVPAGGGFSEITIHRFRRLNSVQLKGLRKINIIAGINNSGKTTLLEAVKLLSSLNHSEEFINLVRRRAKVASEQVDIQWFVDQLPSGELAGTFAGKAATLKLETDDLSLEDMTQYLKSVCFDAAFGDRLWHSEIHFFEKYPRRTEGEFASICPSVFSSPFSGLEPDLLKDCHAKSLKEGSKQLIIEFIRSNIDSGITNIEQDDRGHFIVIHDAIDPNPDLTKFGEGLQRIFKIGLLFAGARNGVVIIDEFENAIHTGLLVKVTTLLHELANKFNVQVFVSSHSKECIDAFALNEAIPESDISAHSLIEKDGSLICQSFPGERLSSLIESIDFDLRGGPTR
jgi:hypothetical protein